jgi:hypothetical protein
MKISKTLSAAVSMLFLAAASPSFAADANAIPGNVTVARDGVHSLLIWDASPLVKSLTSAKTPRDQALAQLESDALSIAAARASQLTAAHDITVRVVYLKTGDVDPAYGAPTLQGVERLATVQASRGDLTSHQATLVDQLKAGKVPQGVNVSVIGQLPPV